jgi:glycosyltransferase involved in cell wall biosynthesis
MPLMRIAVIAPHFPEYTLRMANGLAAGAEVLLFVEAGQLDAEFGGREVAVASGVTLCRVTYETLGDYRQIMDEIRRFGPDVVHIQEAAGLKKAVMTAAITRAMRRAAAIALTVHDPSPHEGRDAAIARRTAPFRHYVRGRADLVVVHGASCRAEYQNFYLKPGQRLMSVDHGVLFNDAGVIGGAADRLSLLFFGRMEAYKGLDVLLQAVEELAREPVEFGLVIAGRGPELDRLQRHFEALAGVSVFNGFVPPNKLIDAIRSADAILLPYLSATQSGVLAGAFGNGRFVIASAVGGLPDVVADGENGLLVPPGDPHALAGAIRRVALDRELKERLMAGARATGEGRLSWKRIATSLLEAYASLR